MDEAKEVAATLRRARPTLTYFPHRYASWLLGRVVGEGVAARAVKASRYARLLENPLVREIAARNGGGILTRAALERARPERAEVYRIGATTWGQARCDEWEAGWYQTSRPGANLVVLLNFPPQHNAAYRRWLDPGGAFPMLHRWHPHARLPDLTLAWARIDIDLAGGEALIEEVQSDWIRDFRGLWSWVSVLESPATRDWGLRFYFRQQSARFEGLDRYWNRVLAHHRAWWAEATLFAALWLLVEQLHVRRIYYHTHEGGMRRKGILSSEPPRSIYTTLPRRFGFELTSQPPSAFRRRKRSRRRRGQDAEELPWYRLDL